MNSFACKQKKLTLYPTMQKKGKQYEVLYTNSRR